jgi:hypothetical protein
MLVNMLNTSLCFSHILNLQNLNKILGTPLDVRNGWAVDACYHSGTLYLDIVAKNDNQEGPDADRFTYYGYKVSDGAMVAPALRL